IVAVARGQQIERVAAIDRLERARVQDINRVGGFWIGVNLTEVPGALTKTAIVVYPRPMLTGILGAINAAVFCFNDGVNPVRVCTGNGDADFSQNSARQSISFQMLPGNAVVFRPVKSTPRSAAGKKPRLPAGLPKRGKNDVRVMRIENDVDAAGVFIFAQNFRPGFSAIRGAINAALLVWTKGVTDSGDQYNV